MFTIVTIQDNPQTNSTLTLQNISDLSINIPKPGVYEIEGMIIYTAPDGIDFGMTVSDADAFAMQVVKGTDFLVPSPGDSAGVIAAKEFSVATLKGIIKITGENRITLQFASKLDGSLARVRRGSMLKVIRRF